jgi:hypothetical protein
VPKRRWRRLGPCHGVARQLLMARAAARSRSMTGERPCDGALRKSTLRFWRSRSP